MTNHCSPDIVERLRSSEPLPACPYDRLSPHYLTAPNDKPCAICGGLNDPDAPDLCRGADTRIMGEAADEIERLREDLASKDRAWDTAMRRMHAAEARAGVAQSMASDHPMPEWDDFKRYEVDPTDAEIALSDFLDESVQGWDRREPAKVVSDATMPKWRHLKRGSIVTEIARGFAQVSHHPIEEMTAVVIYRHDADGRYWVRNAVEFDDGRFEALTPLSSTQRGQTMEEAAANNFGLTIDDLDEDDE